ncbi:MAG TPA: hypothetical protein DHV15_05025 [Treponema sp.]|uniref:Uncharacterized protein n=1 Tax=Treponema denticola (strain ATCC 35405 / DSM 14222 / CIP 103919 / JCM 8153 / KCTC 15104) TaxID=243275 RepID=Q73KY5_TREDE|nr:hypothetical protein TDE_2082 [Treponema denticola ATCC 35405]HCY94863.1 hypothetical protein [Treponema sp.]
MQFIGLFSLTKLINCNRCFQAYLYISKAIFIL